MALSGFNLVLWTVEKSAITAVIFRPVTYSVMSNKWEPMSAMARESPDLSGSSLQL